MKNISEVSPSIIEEFRAEWTGVCLDTRRANKAVSERAITHVYEKSGHKKPRFIWSSSPADAVAKMVKHNIAKSNYPSAEASLAPSGGYMTHESIISSTLADLKLGADRREEVRKEFMKAANSFFGNCFYGQHEWWVPHYLFPMEHMDAEVSSLGRDIVSTWATISRNCGWWACFPDVCLCVDKPIAQHLDDQQRTHKEDGPAILYEDGMAVWVIDGLLLDEKAVMRPQEQTIEEIHGEENQDARSLRIERMGWPLYLQRSNSRVIHSRHNEIENTEECLMETPAGERRLVVTCPTNRMFALGVPNDVEDCHQAQAWIANGKDPNRVIART
jgi:hypothetical protein